MNSEQTTEMYKHISHVQNNVIQYPSVTKLLMKFRQAVLFRESTGNPRNCMVYGRPGVGKTTLRKCIEQEFPPIQEVDRTIYPVLTVTIPSRPTVKNVAEEILATLGDECFAKGSSVEKTKRIINYVKDMNVKAFIFDEMQHFVDGGNKNTPREVADWLKVLIDTSKASTILLGTESAKEILNINSQLSRRFSDVVELEPLSISTPKDYSQFAAMVRHIDMMLKLPNQIDYMDSKLIVAIHFATNGIMDYIVKLLVRAYEIAIFNGYTQITRKLLEEAFTGSIWNDGIGELNPFNPKFVNRYLDYKKNMPFKIKELP